MPYSTQKLSRTQMLTLHFIFHANSKGYDELSIPVRESANSVAHFCLCCGAKKPKQAFPTVEVLFFMDVIASTIVALIILSTPTAFFSTCSLIAKPKRTVTKHHI